MQLGKFYFMDGELKHLKTGQHKRTGTLWQSWGKNLHRLIPTPVPWAKHHLSFLKSLHLFSSDKWTVKEFKGLSWLEAINCDSKVNQELKFPLRWLWPLPLELRGTIKPPGMHHDLLCCSSDEIENSEHFGTQNRHQWTVNYIYICMSIFLLWNHW